MHPCFTVIPLASSPHPCGYLAGRRANFEHYYIPNYDAPTLSFLIEAGFRHFGDYFFRPACAGRAGMAWCGACVPLRLPVADFTASRSQRRVWRKGSTVRFRIERPSFTEEKYALYLRHQQRFEPLPGDDNPAADELTPSRESFITSFITPGACSYESRLELDGRLLGVGYLDVTRRLVSTVYFYFDPDCARLSPGTLSILCEIEFARARGIPYYYLGYLVESNASMRYKAGFSPCEVFDGKVWRTLRAPDGRYQLDPVALRTTPFTSLLADCDAPE